MSVYFVVEVEVTDPAAYDRYRPLAADTIAKFGGRYVVRGGKTDLLEGDAEPKRIVILEFASAAAFHRWYDSAEYQEALKIRLAASRSRAFLVEGAG